MEKRPKRMKSKKLPKMRNLILSMRTNSSKLTKI